jgi:hypothetical protein
MRSIGLKAMSRSLAILVIIIKKTCMKGIRGKMSILIVLKSTSPQEIPTFLMLCGLLVTGLD